MTLLDQQLKIGFIGAGRVAGNLAASFIERGYAVAAVSSKNDASAKALAQKLPSITSHTSNQSVVDECDVVFVVVLKLIQPHAVEDQSLSPYLCMKVLI